MYKLIIFLTLCLCFLSCEQDDVIELDYPEPKMVITSALSNGKPAYISVYNSLNVEQAPVDQKFLTDAEVILSDNTGYTEILRLYELTEEEQMYADQFTRQTPYYFTSDVLIEEDKTYEIEVREPNYETCYSSQTVPAETPVIKAYVDTASYRLNSNTLYTADIDIYIEFDDPPGPNYYEIFFATEEILVGTDPENPLDTIQLNIPIPVKCDDISRLEDYYTARPSIILTDEFFDGQRKTVKFTTYYDALQEDLEDVMDYISSGTYLHFRHLSKDYYEFGRSLDIDLGFNPYPYLNDYEAENPVEIIEDAISEPRITANNIENGYGVFGAFHENKVRLDWQ